MSKFTLTELKNLYTNGPLKDHNDAKEYVSKYFYQLDSGMIYFSSKRKLLPLDVFRTTYLNRFPKDIAKWFLTENDSLYDVVIDTKQKFIKDDELNLFKGFKYTYDKANSYEKCTEKQKAGVEMMLAFIKTVLASGDNESYTYLINWFANMIQGNKNTTILYMKSITEGIGKSTITTFLMDYVIGQEISIESNSDPLKTSYNEVLSGKSLVVFEELEQSTERDWQVMSTKLKRWSTSKRIMYSEKYLKQYEAQNINNYIINTNCDAIKNSEGRRIYILDLSTKYKNDTKYWNSMHDTCFNADVGEAFFKYMSEVDISKFNSQSFKETKTKELSMNDRLSPLFKFIKFNYVLQGKSIECTTKELYTDLTMYLAMIDSNRKFSKHKMIADLREVGIEYKSSNSKTKYNISHAELVDIANKFKWVSNDDDEELNDNLLYKSNNDDEIIHVGVSSKAYENVCIERDELKKQLEIVRKEIATMNETQLKKVKKVKTAKLIKTKKVTKKQKSLFIEFDSL